MNRWKYPFRSKQAANLYLGQAEKETGKRCFVKQVSVRAHVFKIFSSQEEYASYQQQKYQYNEH